MTALNKQVSGTHYKELAIQPIEYIHANGLDFFQGNVVKYVTRHKAKNGKADIEKAIHYLEMILQFQYGEEANAIDLPIIGDGWIEWNGGQRPLDYHKIVLVKFRDNIQQPMQIIAGRFSWIHNNDSNDIFAYKELK